MIRLKARFDSNWCPVVVDRADLWATQCVRRDQADLVANVRLCFRILNPILNEFSIEFVKSNK